MKDVVSVLARRGEYVATVCVHRSLASSTVEKNAHSVELLGQRVREVESCLQWSKEKTEKAVEMVIDYKILKNTLNKKVAGRELTPEWLCKR